MKRSKRIVAVILALVLALGLASCGGNATSSSTTEEELVGKPWVSSYIIGNLPAETPAAADDAFTHYNYTFLAENQERGATEVALHAGELQDSIVAMIGDESLTGA